MDQILIKNIDYFSNGTLDHKKNIVIEENRIKGIFDYVPDDKFNMVIDGNGKLLIPGFVNMHMHLYSTFARGMILPNFSPINFVDILNQLWWRLDKALNEEDIYYSALIPLMEGIKAGTTTVFDHHASPSFIKGSLAIIEKAYDMLNIRGSLSYEISDRNNHQREELEENLNFISNLRTKFNRRLIGHVGLHALFTLSDDTLKIIRDNLPKDVGIHVHVGEDLADVKVNNDKYGMRLVERLAKFDLLNDKTLLIHGIYIDKEDLDFIKKSGAMVIHNPRSNANNAVGVLDINSLLKNGINVGLGTDGMDNDMLAEASFGFKVHRLHNKNPMDGFMEMRRLLMKNNYEIASKLGNWNLGKIEQGAVADLVVMDYLSPTPVTSENLWGHFMFAKNNFIPETVIINGKVIYYKKNFLTVDEKCIYEKAQEVAQKMWTRI